MLRGTRALRALQLLAVVFLLGAVAPQAPRAADSDPAPMASGWTIVKFPQPQPLCTGVGLLGSLYFDRLDCGFGYVTVSETTPESTNVVVDFVGPDGNVFETQETTYRVEEDAWEFSITPTASWPAGDITLRARAGDTVGGETTFFHNKLGASIAAEPQQAGYAPGDPVTVTGTLFEQDSVALETNKTDVAGTYSLRVVTPSGEVRGPYGPFTADQGGAGQIEATLPAEATAGVTATAETGFQVTVAVDVVDAAYADPLTGDWRAAEAGTGAVTLSVAPDSLLLESSFVSSVGWVKPGATYPFRVFVKNHTPSPATGASVTIPAVDGMSFTNATPTTGSGSATASAGSITWTIDDVPAATDGNPAVKTLVVEAKADTVSEDQQIVWKNLSTTATLAYDGGPSSLASTTHGPKVIPQSATYDTARYGDRPFPVVPVDFFDRKHEGSHTGDRLAAVINSPDVEGSTFNLYQEMSYEQLFPHGTVPSAGIASAGWDANFASPRYQDSPFQFTDPQPQGTCKGVTWKDARDTAVYPERISNGWYQMPGDTEYYGGDKTGSALVGALIGVGLLFDIDSACGPTGKAVYDAAVIADPEIDYSDYDTDKDGVVDFFMMVFVGAGGHGASQTSVPPYDNIWPHSSSLEFYYTDPDTGLKGYISDDQLEDLEGRPLFYTDESRTTMTTDETDFPVYVRVGPYNVNPESSIEHASVISHEYGHSLGLPDFYSLGGRETYGDWNLMATDKSQHMDVFGKQELGWLVPRVLEPGETSVSGWRDSKTNTQRIDWKTPDGTPYTLQGEGVANGEAYVAKLPARQIIDPQKVAEGASPDHVWWSESGNDFGCTPQKGHNLDIALPELATVPEGTPVTVSFKSYWNIEWDFDYGFVMYSTDGGSSYASLPSENGYTTPTFNPNANGCQTQYGNGLTGTSGSYAAGTQDVDRLLGEYSDGGFLADEYDLTAAAGHSTVLRLSYSTDAGLARPGWFVDDLTITAGDQVIYSTDFESSGSPDDPRVFNGGCKDALRTAATCTAGWQYVDAASGSAADHAYYLEMRDRSGFDLDGKGQNDRDPIGFAPGMLLVYTDEAHGYGNVGTDDPPAQNPLDSQPEPGNETPNLDDAAFTAAAGDSSFTDSGEGHTDNYTDPSSEDGLWHLRFGCLGFDVLSMLGADVGPATAPGDLQGDVSFTLGDGCAPFDYGYVGDNAPAEPPNTAPTAVVQVKPKNPVAGKPVTFDGSLSSDAEQAASELTYEWDFDGDGTVDAAGQSVRHTYEQGGDYTVTLLVTDAGGLSDEATVVIRVRGPR